MKKGTMLLIVITLLIGVGLQPLFADEYPTRPIRMIVPFPPGGGNDLLARSISQPFSQAIGQQVIIDNRGGAGGQIGATLAAAAAPDGYTTFLGSIGNLTFHPVLQAKLPYDPVRDFAPVTLLATSAFILVVNPAVPAKSVKELIALAKAKPGQLNFCSGGPGSSLHMTGELFKFATGIDITHVPYKGNAPAIIELLAGQVQMLFGLAKVSSQDEPIPWIGGQRGQRGAVDRAGQVEIADRIEFHRGTSPEGSWRNAKADTRQRFAFHCFAQLI